ncbi:hypothetical protein [Haloferax sp. YSMS24]|uniref:hypothetical protein n=1 Tax=Haloferax sp. YSMS24 TaxID=3388425 RepID=UPI00398D657A
MSMTVSGGSGAVIMGYPLIYRGPSFPVARNATISSPYGRYRTELEGTVADIPKKSFLTDAVTHDGLSGSPIISVPPGGILQDPNHPETVFRAATLMKYDNRMSLLGVHAGEADVLSELQLNNAVYSSAITEVIQDSDS